MRPRLTLLGWRRRLPPPPLRPFAAFSDSCVLSHRAGSREVPTHLVHANGIRAKHWQAFRTCVLHLEVYTVFILKM